MCVHACVCVFSFFFSALSLVTEGRKLVFAPCHYWTRQYNATLCVPEENSLQTSSVKMKIVLKTKIQTSCRHTSQIWLYVFQRRTHLRTVPWIFFDFFSLRQIFRHPISTLPKYNKFIQGRRHLTRSYFDGWKFLLPMILPPNCQMLHCKSYALGVWA